MAQENSRPLLLPQNRRLRHIQGLYLRNLTLSRPRGHTIDDAALNKSPEKLKALRESLQEPQLHHSQSSDTLSTRVRPGKMRRRSTNWTGQSPAARQKKLEEVIDGGTADSFFSLHVDGEDEPVYISEVINRAMNPSFRFFDLSTCSPSIRRSSSLTIKIWVKRREYNLLLSQSINLEDLSFIGRLEDRVFPSNCILLHLTDGVYGMNLSSNPPPPKPTPSLPSSSYSALMRLSSLDESIQDALATRETLAAQINAILETAPISEAPQAADSAARSQRYVTSSRKLLKASMKRRSELLASLQARRRAIEEGNSAQEHAQSDVTSAQDKLKECQHLLLTTTNDIHGQRRRICEELLHIFPIESTTTPLLFTICGLELPNTSFDDSDEDVLAAALGLTARLVNMLQYYLSVPLPYPVTPYASRSLIHDRISMLADSQRTFPLYTKGSVRFRFDYAVFLLNKDIECLAESQGLKVIDIRHTLPNLKYLLYVCSAGSSELPMRKAGGIRGLLSGRVPSGLGALHSSISSLGLDSNNGTPNLSRRGSDDSVARRVLENGGKDVKKEGDGRNLLDRPALHLPFEEATTMSFRGKGMRERNVR